ncbi:stage V sporulation protein AA [Cellulophaga sp. HaHaR_3_176]|uniref:stage V sporulation protein AA n=1 Tax=Cellulophaga sp. HaHaR_3_176 TaxID=1942464 RepID=UPI001C1FA9B7|nr:stage V sporulation protein AA [Cellulophaga sp. HaHaR_3_176]QWX83125.1 stage V sporulation protein AA [Cellulophaga sp. HaHaR_3_176]
MNVSDFTYLLQHPEKVVSPVQTNQLDDILDEFPYFQAARAIQLKGLRNLNSFKYNSSLKTTAAYTADRDILFDFITSKEFVQNTIADSISGKSIAINDQEIEFETIVADKVIDNLLVNTDEQEKALPQNIKDAEQILDPSLFSSKDPKIDLEIAETKKKAKENLIGNPLPFSKKDKYSFGEWMQLASQKPIERTENNTLPAVKKEAPSTAITDSNTSEEDELKKKKFDLIDQFIQKNPKIVPKEKNAPVLEIEQSTQIDKKELMTETLAKVYLEQKKYKKAIQAYKILSLKYPKKSSFFASQIKLVQKIQKENK